MQIIPELLGLLRFFIYMRLFPSQTKKTTDHRGADTNSGSKWIMVLNLLFIILIYALPWAFIVMLITMCSRH